LTSSLLGGAEVNEPYDKEITPTTMGLFAKREERNSDENRQLRGAESFLRS